MVPTIKFDFFGFVILVKVDSNSFFLYMFKSWQDLYERWLAIYKRVTPAEDSVGVNSIEYFLMFRLFVMETFFAILISVIAILSKLLFVKLRRCWRSWKFLLKEHAFIWNKESELLLFVIFRFEVRQCHSI